MINAAIAASQAINLNQSITVGSLSMGDVDGSSSYVIAGNGGALTFDNGINAALLTQLASSRGDVVAAPVILNTGLMVENDSTNLLTLSGNLSGAGSWSSRGAGLVLLAGSNSFGGPVTVGQGTLRIGNASALGANSAMTTIMNGATLDVNGFGLGPAAITVAGAGADGAGAIINSAGAPQTNALRSVTLTDDATFGGASRWDMRGTNQNVLSAGLNSMGEPFQLTKAGINQISLVDVNIDPGLGDIDIQQGELSFEGVTSSMGNPANGLAVAAVSTLALANTVTLWNKIFTLNGDGLTTTLASAAGSNTLVGPVTLNGACVVDVTGTALTMASPVTGSGGLSKTSAGTLYLSAANSFQGGTVVGAGTLALAGAGSLAGSTNISIAAGAFLDVAAMTGGGMILAGGQTLAGRGAVRGNVIVGNGATLAPGNAFGVLTFSNSLTLASGGTCLIAISKSPTTNDQVRVLGSLAYGGTLMVNNAGINPPVAGDSFKLFNAGSYAGAFSRIIPLTPAPGLAWDSSGLATNGTLKVVTITFQSHIDAVTLAASNLVFSGSGGTVGGAYRVLASTNLFVPMSEWTPVASNFFDLNGGFAFTNAVTAGFPDWYYTLQLLNGSGN